MLGQVERAWIVAVLLAGFRTPLAVALGLVLWAMPLPGAWAVDVDALALKDQFGETAGLAAGGGDALQIAIVVSAKRLRRIKPWEQAIRRIDKAVPVIRVADIPRTAPTEYEVVAAKLKKRLPEDLPVLIDLAGVWMTAFDLDTSVPNVLIFDASGALLARHSGMYRANRFAALEADLRTLAGDAAHSSAQSP